MPAPSAEKENPNSMAYPGMVSDVFIPSETARNGNRKNTSRNMVKIVFVNLTGQVLIKFPPLNNGNFQTHYPGEVM
jgi:hypothetical protein